jgi:hypothetical protein
MMMAERVRRGEKTMALNLLAVASEPTPRPPSGRFQTKEKRMTLLGWSYWHAQQGEDAREEFKPWVQRTSISLLEDGLLTE